MGAITGLLTVQAAMRTLGVDRSTLYRWERRGMLLPLRDYRGWRFYRPNDLERLRRWREPSEQRGLRKRPGAAFRGMMEDTL